MKSRTYAALISAMTIIALLSFPITSTASHSWGNYHWARTANPFNLRVVDSNTTDWDDNLNGALSDWSTSTVLNLIYEAGDSLQKTRKRCAMVTGKVRSCSSCKPGRSGSSFAAAQSCWQIGICRAMLPRRSQ